MYPFHTLIIMRSFSSILMLCCLLVFFTIPETGGIIRPGLAAGASSNGLSSPGHTSAEIKNIEKELLEIPLYKAISLHDPETYKSIKEQYKAVFTKGNSMVDLQYKMRPVLQGILDRRMSYASDDALRDFAKLILEQTTTLYDLDPELCDIYLGAYLNENIDPQSFASYFAPELILKEQAAISRVIISSYSSANRPIDENKMEPLRLMVFDKVSSQYPDAGKALTDIEYAINNPGRFCVVNYALYEAMLELPEKSSGNLMRYIFSE